jgi:D-sedoheptulose 7-phosphate isomerase
MTQYHTDTYREVNELTLLRQRFGRSIETSDQFFSRHAEAIASCASAMADRFFEGGKLIVLGFGCNTSDAQHNSVEYVHPVLPGCRALPALSLTNDTGAMSSIAAQADPEGIFARQIKVLSSPGDILLAFADLPVPAAILRGLEAARERGLLTCVLLAGTGEPPGIAQRQFHVNTDDALVAQEVYLAAYHILWELVHIVLNHRGIRG